MMTFETLMAGHTSAEVLCLYRGEVVRRLTVKGNMIEIDAITVKVEVRMNTPIVFTPWCMDRGNLTFYVPDLGGPNGTVAKLCTEHDRIKYDDGTEGHIDPA
jgi:hypothetical protein